MDIDGGALLVSARETAERKSIVSLCSLDSTDPLLDDPADSDGEYRKVYIGSHDVEYDLKTYTKYDENGHEKEVGFD